MDRRSFTALAGATAFAVGAADPGRALADDNRHHEPRRGRPQPKGVYVVGHRGASGYRPEHTLESYRLAARMGADFIEPDLVITKDGVLVCRHEPEIGGTTDVARHPEFASRRTTKSLDGASVTGWFVEDFTLAELRTLRAVERIPEIRQHNTVYDGLWQVPTFEEVLKLRRELSRELGREIGVYPETKHPTYFQKMGKPLEKPLVRLLRAYNLDRPKAPVRVQSFELTNLLDLRRKDRVRAPLVFLTTPTGAPFDLVTAGDKRTYADLLTRSGMRSWAPTLDGVGPDSKQVIAWNSDGTLGSPTRLVADAHAYDLEVCPYTVRAENTFLPKDLRTGTVPSNYGQVLVFLEKLFATGIDGIFSDNPDLAVLARDTFVARRRSRVRP